MKSRSFQILINVVSTLWCPLEWVSKIKTDSSGLTLTLLYYSAAVTRFSAAFAKTRFSPIYDPLSHIAVCPEFYGINSVTRGCPVDYLQNCQNDLKTTLEQGKPTILLKYYDQLMLAMCLCCGAHGKKVSAPMALEKHQRQLIWCLFSDFVTQSEDSKSLVTE